MVDHGVDGDFLLGCRVRARGGGGGGVQVLHLLFAGDILIFYEPSQD